MTVFAHSTAPASCHVLVDHPGLLALAVLRLLRRLLERGLLVVLAQAGEQDRVARGDLVLEKRLPRRLDQVGELQPLVDVGTLLLTFAAMVSTS